MISIRAGLIGLCVAALLSAQARPPVLVLPRPPEEAPQPQPAKPPAEAAKPQGPAAQQPAAPKPSAAKTAQAAPRPPAATPPGGFNLNNASLVEVIDILAQRLKINYILDPRVKGGVTISTYGEIKPADEWQLLETILRINGAAIVQVGSLYRIVPTAEVARLPIRPTVNAEGLPDGEAMVLNLVFLKYATVSDLEKLLEPFLGEGAKMVSYSPANLLLILDNARNMRRTMDLIAMFDSDSFAGQRVRLFEVQNSRPSDIADELSTVFRAFALSEKTASVKFMPIDRINTIIAVAPNPGIFAEVEKWIKKLDLAVKAPAGAVNNYVYRLKYGRAETLAMAIMQLYLGYMGYSGYGMGGYGMGGYGMGGFGMGGYGMGGYGTGGYGQLGMGGYGAGGYGMGSYGYPGMATPGYGMMGMGFPGMGGYGYAGQTPPLSSSPASAAAAAKAAGQAGTTGATGTDLTGSYLGAGYGAGAMGRIPHVIPNPFDNTLLIQASPQEWEQIRNLLRQLDVPPRQVLIEAKIYEVSLTGAFASGVAAALQKQNSSLQSGKGILPRIVEATGSASGALLTGSILVGQARELLATITASEEERKSRILSAPSVIATDSIPASINVGIEVPTLTSQAASAVQQGGNTALFNTVASRNSGVALNIMARVNSSGIVTLEIDQEVSAPQAPPAGVPSVPNSPSFSKRNVKTVVTVQDGDTIAIGGIMQETNTLSSAGIPVLHRLPGVGMLFGSRNYSKERTELIVFLTPRVIYDTNQITDATEELKSRLKRVQKLIKE